MAAPIDHINKLVGKIKTFAVVSRLILILLQVVFNNVIPDHDAGVFNPPFSANSTMLDSVVQFTVNGFRRWDAIYFTHIAQHGYTYENTLAFFPLYAIGIHLTASVLNFPLSYVLSYHNVVLVSSLFINLILFVKSAEVLFHLGRRVLGNDVIAYKAALLFCITPASIFMTAPYSESLYTYLTFSGLLCLERNKKLAASVFIGLSFVTRSNGALNICYLLYVFMKNVVKQLKSLQRVATMNMGMFLTIPWIFIMTTVIPYAVLLCVCVTPFLVYQYYCYSIYCSGSESKHIPEDLLNYARLNSLKLPDDEPLSAWCSYKIPLAYSYIQTTYWDQGFLQYWQWKQIPNFLLATPVAVLVVKLAYSYYTNNRYTCLSLGLDEAGAMKKDAAGKGDYYTLSGAALLPYVLHALALVVFGWFCIHVQVLTRLLFSSCPVLYWYCAHLVSMTTPQQPIRNKYDVFKSTNQIVEKDELLKHAFKNLLSEQIVNFRIQTFGTKIILTYFIGYFVVGTALFCNFLPWT